MGEASVRDQYVRQEKALLQKMEIEQVRRANEVDRQINSQKILRKHLKDTELLERKPLSRVT